MIPDEIKKIIDSMSFEEVAKLAYKLEMQRGQALGVSVGQLVNDELPVPTYIIRQGQDIPDTVMQALKNGEAALVIDDTDNVVVVLVMDSTAELRSQKVEEVRKENQRRRLKYFPGEG